MEVCGERLFGHQEFLLTCSHTYFVFGIIGTSPCNTVFVEYFKFMLSKEKWSYVDDVN